MQLAALRPLIQCLNVLQPMFKPITAQIDFVLRDRVEHEPGPEYSEESHGQEPLEQSDAEESIAGSGDAETQNVELQQADLIASPESVISFGGAINATAPGPAATPLRRGFLKQLLSRFSSGEE